MALQDHTRVLLERSHELTLARSLARGALNGDGGLLLIEGPAGMGKSALVASILQAGEEEGLAPLLGTGSELDADFPFCVARELFGPALRDGDQGAALLSGPASLAGPLFGLGDGGGAPDIDAVVHGLYWLCANIADRGPLLLVIDDAHWSDTPTLRALVYLARRLEGMPLLLVCAARPDGPEAQRELLDRLATTPGQRTLSLEPLSAEAAAVVVREALGEDASDALCGSCHEATGGNPFYLRELLAGLRESGRIDPSAVLALGPRTVGRSVMFRLEALSAAHTEVARAVAVLGPAPLARVAAYTELPVDAVAACADDLAVAQILLPRRPLAFVHAIVRNAIAESMPPSRRAAGHRRAAELLAAEERPPLELAGHLLWTEPTGDAWVVERLREAAADATRRGSPDAAATYLERALAEPPEQAARRDVLLELARVEARIPRETAIARFEQVLSATDGAAERARLVLELAPTLALASRQVEARDAIERALGDLDESDVDLAADLHLSAVGVARLDTVLRPEIPRRLAWLEERDWSERPDVRWSIQAQLAREDVLAARPAQRAIEHVRRALEAEPNPYERTIYESPLCYAIISLFTADEFDLAREMSTRMIAAARDRGDLQMVACGLCYQAITGVRCGDLPSAEADARQALALLGGWELIFYLTLNPLVDALTERGEYNEVATTLGAAGMLDPDRPIDTVLHNLVEARGRYYLATKDPQSALKDFLAVGVSRTAEGVACPAISAWRSGAALASHALGDLDRARELAGEELEQARGFGAPRALGIALRAYGLVSGDRAALEEAVTVLAPSPARLEHARALVDLGGAIRRAGKREAAREPLREGLDIATRCGGAALAARARDELLASGARPRRTALSGVAALTPSERRVAELAAEGMTNREIAQALFLTPKTIEDHLRACYRKLDLGGRRELPQALAAA